jgi:transposase
MEIVHHCCAGLDVHKDSVVACVRRVGPDGRAEDRLRTFGTTTARLLELADWLEAQGVRPVAMESTGEYWKPVFHILEGRFAVMVVNAGRLKQVPGRKTDMKDAQWIAELLGHGLLSPSFVPPPPVRQLRDLTRQRAQLVRDKAAVANRIQKVLEDANIKLASVATDVLGVSGRAMLRALIAGRADPEALAELARARLRAKLPALREALWGRVTEHHRFQLRLLLEQVEQMEAWVERLSARIERVLRPFAAVTERLTTIPGVGLRTAEVIVAEIGPDMAPFPSAGHLTSWAGLCPGNHRSAGKQKSGRTTKGSRWLRTALVQAAWAAVHTKETIFAATYRRWVKRLGKRKALVAVARKILVVAYHVIHHQMDYQERAKPQQAA